MKKITKKMRKRQGRNAFVKNIIKTGEAKEINGLLYIDGGYGSNSKGHPCRLPTVRSSYG